MTQWINNVIIQSKLIGSNRKVSSSYSTKINQSIIYLFIWTLLSIQVIFVALVEMKSIQFTKIDKKSGLFYILWEETWKWTLKHMYTIAPNPNTSWKYWTFIHRLWLCDYVFVCISAKSIILFSNLEYRESIWYFQVDITCLSNLFFFCSFHLCLQKFIHMLLLIHLRLSIL